MGRQKRNDGTLYGEMTELYILAMTREMTEIYLLAMTGRGQEVTVTASTMQHGLRRHGLHDFSSPTLQPVDQTTFTEMAFDEIEKMKKKSTK